MEKKTLKNTPRFYLCHQILMSQPKIFNIKQKGNFESHNKKLIRRNRKDIILSRERMKQSTRTIENLRVTF